MRELDIFPNRLVFSKDVGDQVENQNLQIQVYGRRITKDQTFYEYLIEFLLLFIGEQNGKSGLDKIESYDSRLHYKYKSNIALKRFIFLESSKKENRFDIDEDANKLLCDELKKNMASYGIREDDVIVMLRELYEGFTAFSGDRGWFAKSLLPICKETIFPEAMGKVNVRRGLNLYKGQFINIDVDKKFEFNEHNFMARGGEVYFLHILQGLKEIRDLKGEEEEQRLKNELNIKLENLINSFPQLSLISGWIQGSWENILEENLGQDYDQDESKIKSSCKWISNDYRKRSIFTVQELNNILSVDINEFEKFEILSLGIVMQILRMMSEAASIVATDGAFNHPIWMTHANSSNDDKKVKKISSDAYKDIEEFMIIAVAKMLENIEEIKKNKFRKKKDLSQTSLLNEAYNDSHKLLRKLGKDIGLIVPIKGDNMRFALNDNIVKFLVLSHVEPDKKITLDSFLRKIYDSFGLVIGPKEYDEHSREIGKFVDTSFLQYNLEEFQQLLRKNGFLRELSDATSIVVNPYGKIEVK
ncbi:hypothetical protein [Clostridium culturomicium]|uniref:hypothetical protein n=1 Tax=Clostridium culturomicium TaxID=1499683 RepID=UPI00385717B8